MDIHRLDGPVSADDVAKAHMADLQVQDKCDVRYQRYWASCRLTALILAGAGLTTAVTGPAATAHTPIVEQPYPWCSDTSLLPRTPDAAGAWLRQAGG